MFVLVHNASPAAQAEICSPSSPSGVQVPKSASGIAARLSYGCRRCAHAEVHMDEPFRAKANEESHLALPRREDTQSSRSDLHLCLYTSAALMSGVSSVTGAMPTIRVSAGSL